MENGTIFELSGSVALNHLWTNYKLIIDLLFTDSLIYGLDEYRLLMNIYHIYTLFWIVYEVVI